MRVDLLVEDTVYHNFLRNPQITFPMRQSTVEMESSRYSTETIRTTSLTSLKLSFKYLLLRHQK